ncbi:unnamed protein product [Paramecium sonneborni]|uniref:Uncharacterized protein n=1 Tax=Paramecium sonneborni TaxID=65129 RepID=A0A8S1R289_9CILI|nr:unnamed protein product [Paramecium sonneborni]
MPGSLQSKVVKNMEKAQKLRLERNSQRAINNEILYLKPIMDSKLQIEKQTTRHKSFSIQQQTPQNPLLQNNNQNEILYSLQQLNEFQKLPQIGDNKTQNRVLKQYSFLEEFERRPSILQQCQPMKAFI